MSLEVSTAFAGDDGDVCFTPTSLLAVGGIVSRGENLEGEVKVTPQRGL